MRFLTQLERLKTEFTKNRGKSLFLAGSTVLLVIVCVHMFWSPAPRSAAASVNPDFAADARTADPVKSHDLEEKMRQSAALWQVLREKRGLDAADAFNFNAQFYTLDPARRIVTTEPDRVDPTPKAGEPSLSEEDLKRLRIVKAQQDSRRLNLQAVMLGADPTALINSELKRVGDHVLGFTLKSIQERQVLVEKDGVTLAVDMSR